jgi:Acetamidase/Formamidase family
MSARHTLRAQVGTVHRGVFDSTLPPVLTVASGDVVEVTTLSGNPDQIPPPELGFTVHPENRDVLARVPTGEGPHLLTGPIAVEGAMPGDELVVEVLEMKLAQDWGWNRFAPGMGTLPEQFPNARCIHIAIDRAAGTVTLPWGSRSRRLRFSASSASRRRLPWGARTRSFRAPSAAISTTNISARAPRCTCRCSIRAGFFQSATAMPCKATAKSA